MRALTAVLATLTADAAWNLAGPFWGFTVLALLVLWLALQPHITTGSKAYRTEQRLNAVIPNIPNPQTSPGAFGGNVSYGIAAATDANGGASGGSTTHPLWSGAAGTDHWHNINGTGAGHSHTYGSQLATDFNALRNSFSDHVTAHNTLVAKLQATNILH